MDPKYGPPCVVFYDCSICHKNGCAEGISKYNNEYVHMCYKCKTTLRGTECKKCHQKKLYLDVDRLCYDCKDEKGPFPFCVYCQELHSSYDSGLCKQCHVNEKEKDDKCSWLIKSQCDGSISKCENNFTYMKRLCKDCYDRLEITQKDPKSSDGLSWDPRDRPSKCDICSNGSRIIMLIRLCRKCENDVSRHPCLKCGNKERLVTFTIYEPVSPNISHRKCFKCFHEDEDHL